MTIYGNGASEINHFNYESDGIGRVREIASDVHMDKSL